MDHFVLFLFNFFLEEGAGGKYEKKFLHKFYRRNINRAERHKAKIYIYILQISPEKIFMQKKNFHFIFNY